MVVTEAKMTRWFLFVTALLLANPAGAQQAVEFDDYTVHYNALNTSELTPQIAQAYSIQRSSSRALLNITVLDSDQNPVTAGVTANAFARER